MALGLLVVPVFAATAQDAEDPVAPPGAEHVGLASISIERPTEDDPEPEGAPVFSYDTDGHQLAYLFAADEDWCRHALVVQLEVEATAERLGACLEWVAQSAFGGTRSGIGRVMLPETWAVRIAQRAGWYGDVNE